MYYTCLVSNPPDDQEINEVAKKLCVALKNDMEWENFGMNLLKTESKDELILISQEAKTLLEKCVKLLELWKERTSEAKWEQVIKALKSVSLNRLAGELKNALKQEQPHNTRTYRAGTKRGHSHPRNEGK